MKPNIFNIATKELSQDAFITWLLQWGSNENKKYDKDLQECGADFAKRLIRKKFPKFNEKIIKINADRHWEDIDIWAEINDKYLIIIEDKINTTQHSDQLARYRKISNEWCKNNNYILVCIYLKTGNESKKSLDAIIKEKYEIFNRNEFIELLENYNISNDIFKDFLERLKLLEKLNNQWETKIIKKWEGNDWQGFYQYLEREIDIIDWGYVNNPSGGFWNAVLNWDYYDMYPLYLQTEEYKLCFKISTHPEEVEIPKKKTRSDIRNEISDFILKNAKKCKYPEIKKPERFGSGNYMTVAVIDSKYWLGDQNKIINKEIVVKNISKYLEFLYNAINNDA